MPALPNYIDTHSHLNHPYFQDRWESLVWRALEQGTWMIVIGSDLVSSVRAVEIAKQFPYGVYAAVGVHPLAANSFHEEDMKTFRELARHPKTVAIGEVGLDFRHFDISDELHREKIAYEQQSVFLPFLSLADELRLPVVLHTHDAHDEFRTLFKQRVMPRGIVHHFTGSGDDAKQYQKNDFLISITDTLARSHTRQDVIAKTAHDRIIIESECPHLVPTIAGVAYNEPSHISNTVLSIAGLRKMDAANFARQITRNALCLFPKIVRTLPF